MIKEYQQAADECSLTGFSLNP